MLGIMTPGVSKRKASGESEIFIPVTFRVVHGLAVLLAKALLFSS